MSLTQAGQWGAVGTKYGPPGPSEDLGGTQKGILGPKTTPFRAPWGPEGARYQVKVYADHESKGSHPLKKNRFLDALASLETTQVGESVSE